jgi:hypothetical protein
MFSHSTTAQFRVTRGLRCTSLADVVATSGARLSTFFSSGAAWRWRRGFSPAIGVQDIAAPPVAREIGVFTCSLALRSHHARATVGGTATAFAAEQSSRRLWNNNAVSG